MLEAYGTALIKSLRACRLFRGITEPDVSKLTQQAAVERYQAGDILFRRDDAAERFFVVLEGRVALHLDGEGDPSGVARIAGPGEKFYRGLHLRARQLFCHRRGTRANDRRRYPARAAPCAARAALRPVLAMLGEMSFRLRGLVRQITDLKMKTTAQRLAVHLVRLTEAESGPAEIRLPYGKKLLASQLGMQPETLSRAFLKLQPLGVRCVVSENLLRIRDVAVLREFSEDAEENA
jgi:CRP/FNR family transcriptional regulator, dissimilatory nitrate respiration regulator